MQTQQFVTQVLLTDKLRRAALVLVGHGSARNASSSGPTRRLAEALRQRNLFAEVTACFWKEAPPLRAALSMVSAAEVFVVPNFVGVGCFTNAIIPREMGLVGSLTEVANVNGDVRLIHYIPPIGAHPWFTRLVRQRVEKVAMCYDLNRANLCLLLVGHGSRLLGGSSETAKALAVDLLLKEEICTICTAYIEHEPMVAHWPSLVTTRDVVVIPLLISEGLHGSEDLPPLFGLSAADLAATDHFSAVGPILIHGHRIWYYRGIGNDPDIIDIILDQVMVLTTNSASPYAIPRSVARKIR